jgi:myotubularin-related protein 6/7/8
MPLFARKHAPRSERQTLHCRWASGSSSRSIHAITKNNISDTLPSLPLQVENISVLTRGVPSTGTLHLTPHHLIFRYARPPAGSSPAPGKAAPPMEMWITYPIIQSVTRLPMSVGGFAALRIRCRDFNFITFHFSSDKDARDVFLSVKSLTVRDSLEKLYAFYFKPPPPERAVNGWTIYDPIKEYERMGIGTRSKDWRVSRINNSYAVSMAGIEGA